MSVEKQKKSKKELEDTISTFLPRTVTIRSAAAPVEAALKVLWLHTGAGRVGAGWGRGGGGCPDAR